MIYGSFAKIYGSFAHEERDNCAHEERERECKFDYDTTNVRGGVCVRCMAMKSWYDG